MNDTRPPYDDYSRGVDETEQFRADDRPWYLKRWVLALWGLTVVILIAGIIWGLAILARGNGGSAPTPSTTRTTTTTSTTTSTPSTTEPTTTTPSEGTTIEPVPTTTWTSQHPRRHWWRSNVPPIPPMPPVPHF